jgi:hypothetical protein
MFAAITVSRRPKQKSGFQIKVALSTSMMFMLKNSIIFMPVHEHLYVNVVPADAFSHTADKI